ncbi:hypothetical protein Dimus_033513, partial [Dionaea muscipula]
MGVGDSCCFLGKLQYAVSIGYKALRPEVLVGVLPTVWLAPPRINGRLWMERNFRVFRLQAAEPKM